VLTFRGWAGIDNLHRRNGSVQVNRKYGQGQVGGCVLSIFAKEAKFVHSQGGSLACKCKIGLIKEPLSNSTDVQSVNKKCVSVGAYSVSVLLWNTKGCIILASSS